jgi:hypothetical protein
LACLAACTTYSDQLARSQQAFDKNEHERTLGLLRGLETDENRLSRPEQARYAYLRGMTDFRVGHHADARHWLALASVHEDAAPGTLPADWRTRMVEALEELNAVVYREGIVALATRKPGDSVVRQVAPE